MRRPLNYGSENGLHYTYQSAFEITDSRSFFVMKFHKNNPFNLKTELMIQKILITESPKKKENINLDHVLWLSKFLEPFFF